MFRTFSFFCIIIFSSLAAHADELLEYLKRYEGRWVGAFTVHSTATGYSETFSVEQHYWWEDGQLHGISVSETSRGIQSGQSLTYIQDGQLQSEVIQGDSKAYYIGLLHDSGIVWLPADTKRITDYQMKEAFATVDGEVQLNTDGFDSYVYREGLAHLVYRGRLVKQQEVAD